MGIPPQLAGRAEVIRRHTGEYVWVAVRVETEQLPLRPDVSAVVRDEDRQIAHDLDRSRAAGVTHVLPLLEKQELREFVQPDLSSQRVVQRAIAYGSRWRCRAPTLSMRHLPGPP